MPRQNAKQAILDAAETVVTERGAAHLTLDAVAGKAGVSKGGLIYNFPTKESLLEAMLDRQRSAFDRRVVENAKRFENERLGAIKADVLAAIDNGEVTDRKASAALVAVAANNPQLMTPFRAHFAERLESMAALTDNRERMTLLVLAAHGLYLLELLQVAPFDRLERERLVAELMEMVDSIL